MAKQKTLASPGIMTALFRAETYKPTQGLKVRKATGAAIFLAILVAAYQLFSYLQQYLYQDDWSPSLRWIPSARLEYLIPIAMVVVGLWLAWRVVNIPSFADFLIKVEGELAKVTWPSRQQLIRASLVVILLMFLFAATLFAFDLIWNALFHLIGVLHESSPVDPTAPL